MTVENQQSTAAAAAAAPTKWPEQSNNPNYRQSLGRQRHPSNQSIKPEAAQTTPWPNANESHNSNKRKQYCREENAILAMTTTKTIKRPIRIKNSPARTEQAITYNPQEYNNIQKQQPTFKLHWKLQNECTMVKWVFWYYLLEMNFWIVVLWSTRDIT